MKFLLAIIAVVFAGISQAQTDLSSVHVPTEEDVLPKILSPDSPYYYMPMMQRYLAGDETLTDEHYFYLYYGYAYQAEYNAHLPLPGEAVMAAVFRTTTKPTREDALALIEAGRENMIVDPFSPSNLNTMTFAYSLIGDTLGAQINARRFEGIVRAITSSGTGLREKSPWHILRFTHATDIVAARGLVPVNNQIRSRDVEYIQVDRNPAGVKGCFFDFSRVYWKPFEGERVTKKSKWMFNGTPI